MWNVGAPRRVNAISRVARIRAEALHVEGGRRQEDNSLFFPAPWSSATRISALQMPQMPKLCDFLLPPINNRCS